MSVIALPKNAAGNLRDLGRLQDIPAVRQLGLFAMVAAVIALGLWLFFWTQRPNMVPVFAGLDAKATAEASDLLRNARIPFHIDAGSGALAVPSDQIGKARLALAAAGLPSDGASGFEIMQGDQGFGTSQFVENARYQHALEVELARTIANLQPVREARVHLALPKPSAFTRQKEPASASVVLHLRGGSALEPGQVNAIEHLVASSIPRMPVENVTVVDQFGRMLSNTDPDSASALSAARFEQQRRSEAVYVQRIQELLEPMTGPGRVSAQVSIDMSFAETEQASETYGPDPAMIRSEQVSESGNVDALAGGPSGVPGSASNNPDAAATAAAAAAPATTGAGQTSRTAVRNYEIDRTLTHTRQAPGRITRVTAAVLVDNLPQTDAEGNVSYRSLSDAEIERIQTLVQQAIGFDAERGDVVSVVNAPFARGGSELEAPEPPPFWQNPRAQELLRIALGGLAVLALIFVVLRPAFRQLLAPRTGTAVATVLDDDEEPPVTLSAQAAPDPAKPAKPQLKPDPHVSAQAAMNFDEKLQVAKTAVSNDPKRVANVVRTWVDADG